MFSIFHLLTRIPESPRWLLNHGKIEEAENVIIQAAKTNNVEISVENPKTSLRKRITDRTEVMNKYFMQYSANGYIRDCF